LNLTWEDKLVRAIIFAAALMIGGVALAQDAAPPADTPPAADTAAPAPAPAATDASYPPCSAKVQDHCTQGQHASRKPARRAHKAHK
jgi:hypothetical protein